jgi:hypothetical protein
MRWPHRPEHAHEMGPENWCGREALGGTELAADGGKPMVDINVLSKVVSSMVRSPSSYVGASTGDGMS